MSVEEFIDGARGFYFDLALSGGEYTLGLLEKFAKPGRMLYGSDYLYAGVKAIVEFVYGIEGFEWEGGEGGREGECGGSVSEVEGGVMGFMRDVGMVIFLVVVLGFIV